MTSRVFTSCWQAGAWWLAVCCGLLVGPRSLGAVEPTTTLLWPAGAPGALGAEEKDQPKLIIYPAPAETACGAAIVILPGGGYGHLAMGHEGHEIAAWCNSLGCSAFIVDYRHRTKGYGHPAPLQDAQRAIRTVRAEAPKWHVDPQRIGVIGFSAGGHLASSTGVFFDAGMAEDEDPIQRVSCRPDFLILCYPVIGFGESFTHLGSQRNLLGADASPELIRSLSTEKHVTAESPPTFLWHTTEDRPVPPENSLRFYLALQAQQVPAELHVFEKGRHGLGLAGDTPGARDWPGLCRTWLNERGILTPKP